MTIRWLHISDVHERERDGYQRRAMYDGIIAEVAGREPKPDLVFFTGDLAFAGTAAEYQLLDERFLTPLRAALPAGCPIFTVPGNHDVDRRRGAKPRVWMQDADERAGFQNVDDEGRQKRADLLLPRFAGYRAIERDFAAWGEDWLASEQGSVFRVVEIRGRKVALVGINTAWLCQDDQDSGQLSAGRYMLEAALDQATSSNSDVIVVLGHHPLSSMTSDAEWSDGNRIRRRLEQANALYLQGHLHRTQGQRSGDTMESVLSIQAPSGFQAADSMTWRNGLLWGELDLDAGQLVIEPRQWNNDDREYKFDSDAAPNRLRAPGRDAFAYSLPGRVQQSPLPPPPESRNEPAIEAPPEGWQIIDAAALAALTATRPSARDMADWFDGRFPGWEVATAEGVRPRQVVDDLVRLYRAAHGGAPRPVVRLLTGAGGEGKSAALLQVAAGLLRGDQAWSCLWRQTPAELPADWPTLLPRRDGHAWIIAIDDAENVGARLPAALRSLGARPDVHLILAAREADWTLTKLRDSIWDGVADFRRVNLAGLTPEDARRIAESWAAWGDAAMGRLRGQTAETAAKSLLGHAQEFAAKKEEGALLGALLITREGEDYKDRVARLMVPWREAPGIGPHKLLDIYAMIAAMHAENQLYLSRGVLAYALQCDETELDRGPLRILRSEAMVDGSTAYVLTRHRLIAETARDWLADWLAERGLDMDRLYPLLARAALAEFRERRSGNPNINDWQYGLARHFVERGQARWPVARAVAKALFDYASADPLFLTNHAGTLRRTGQPGAALALFREHGPRFPGRRDVLYEWSVAAGAAGDHGLAVWLAARSLADDRSVPFKPKDVKVALAGLGAAFRELGRSIGRTDFAIALPAVCGRLGLRLPDVDPRTRGFFEKDSAAAKPAGAEPTAEADIAVLCDAVVQASYEAEPDNDPEFFAGLILEPDGYRYTMLAAALANAAKRR